MQIIHTDHFISVKNLTGSRVALLQPESSNHVPQLQRQFSLGTFQNKVAGFMSVSVSRRVHSPPPHFSHSPCVIHALYVVCGSNLDHTHTCPTHFSQRGCDVALAGAGQKRIACVELKFPDFPSTTGSLRPHREEFQLRFKNKNFTSTNTVENEANEPSQPA